MTRDIKLISQSPDESDGLRSRLNSGSILSFSQMVRSSYSPLSFPDVQKYSYKTSIRLTLTPILLVNDWYFQSIARTSLYHQALDILNDNSIDWQTNKLKSKWWHEMISVSHLVSTATCWNWKWSRVKSKNNNPISFIIISQTCL